MARGKWAAVAVLTKENRPILIRWFAVKRLRKPPESLMPVLPTARTARFASPLGVYDFQKRSSVLRISPAGAQRLGPAAAILARGEGLEAHARSAEVRAQDDA